MSPITIIPLFTCERMDLGWLASELSMSIHVDAEVSRECMEPSFAYDAARMQYLSTAILERLKEFGGEGGDKVLGVTDVDLFIPILTYVFGEAELNGRAGVVSTYRLRAREDAGERLTHDRLLKESKHEIGHILGLTHCRNINCVLYPSINPEEIDIKGSDFCLPCRRLLNRAI